MASQAERIAALETRQNAVDARLKKIDDKLEKLLLNFEQLTGGKKALLWLTSLVVGCIASVSTAFKVWLEWKNNGGH